MAYDGEGQRVALKVNGGTPTSCLGTLEEIAGSMLTKKCLSASGLPTIVRVGTDGARGRYRPADLAAGIAWCVV